MTKISKEAFLQNAEILKTEIVKKKVQVNDLKQLTDLGIDESFIDVCLERRLVDLSVDELKALDMYYHRPVCELVYLRKSEHAALHMTGHGVHEK